MHRQIRGVRQGAAERARRSALAHGARQARPNVLFRRLEPGVMSMRANEATMKRPYIVFSDVDETLIKFKSMITFMDYFLYETPYAATPAAMAKLAEFEAIKQANTA